MFIEKLFYEGINVRRTYGESPKNEVFYEIQEIMKNVYDKKFVNLCFLNNKQYISKFIFL